jgi:glycosyltransferase involved in cell wall biosynthesis
VTLKVSVIIPCYNEKTTVAEIVRRVRAVGLADEIIIVDDGSTDGTRDVLNQLETGDDLKIVLHTHNQGKGAAVRTGFKTATGDVFLIQDADLEYDPRDYQTLLQPLEEGISDVVYGSRFLGGPRKAMFFWNMVANHTLTLVTNVLYNAILSDMETCYKVFRAEIIRDIPLRARRFDFEPEVTAKILKRGHRIYEVPISSRFIQWCRSYHPYGVRYFPNNAIRQYISAQLQTGNRCSSINNIEWLFFRFAYSSRCLRTPEGWSGTATYAGITWFLPSGLCRAGNGWYSSKCSRYQIVPMAFMIIGINLMALHHIKTTDSSRKQGRIGSGLLQDLDKNPKLHLLVIL